MIQNSAVALEKGKTRMQRTLSMVQRGGKVDVFDTSDIDLSELREKLETGGNGAKVASLRKLLAMISKGMDCTPVFPSVVKNVVSDNMEVKRLVYMFLIHYAREEPDNILLSINTFQKDMRGPNELIRAAALRVLSSIRVKTISHLIKLAIEQSIIDSSPYVRKTACHAIQKLYGIDPDTKDELIQFITKLLADANTLVLGSAVSAFAEVCPERLDLLHPVYRRLCILLADIDAWGQMMLLPTLTRYVRQYFCDPDPAKQAKAATGDADGKKAGDGDGDDDDSFENQFEDAGDNADVATDHRLFLKSATPLLLSLNPGVVMAAATAFFYCAPPVEAERVGKAVARLARSNREVEYVALMNAATMATMRPNMFRANLQDFFVTADDAPFVAHLKLEILTYLANEGNIGKILREFLHYVRRDDDDFVRATIQAIGRCATQIPNIMHSCMGCLMNMLQKRNDLVVAESVVVIKKLLQMNWSPVDEDAADEDDDDEGDAAAAAAAAAEGGDGDDSEAERRKQDDEEKAVIIRCLARMLSDVKVPAARSAILWVIGEYHTLVAEYAPDILRRLAKNFAKEDVAVKLQVLNLGTKLYLTNREQCGALYEHVLTVAKYDLNYDVRDRGRLMRFTVLNQGEKCGLVAEYARELFINSKPVPVVSSEYEERQRWALATTAHVLNQTTPGYEALQPFADAVDEAAEEARAQQAVIHRGEAIGSIGFGGGGTAGGHTVLSSRPPTGAASQSNPLASKAGGAAAAGGGAGGAGVSLDDFYAEDTGEGDVEEFFGDEGEGEFWDEEGGAYDEGYEGYAEGYEGYGEDGEWEEEGEWEEGEEGDAGWE